MSTENPNGNQGSTNPTGPTPSQPGAQPTAQPIAAGVAPTPQAAQPPYPQQQPYPPGPYMYPPVAPPKSGSWILRIFVILVVLGLLLMPFMLIAGVANMSSTERGVQEKHFSHSKQAKDKVAIINIDGVITSGEDYVKKQIDTARKDDNVKAVVLRVNTPGGTISGSDYILHHLKELKKAKGKNFPIVVSMGGIAASGGYYVAMCVEDTPDSIFAEQTTWTGSIGVIIPHYNIEGLMEHIGIQEDSVTSGPLKSMGTFTRPMDEREKKVFKGLVDEGFDRFKQVIMEGRPELKKNPEKLKKSTTGQIFTADQALERGLIDKIGFIEAAIDRAIALAKLDKNKVHVVRYEKDPSLGALLFGSEASKAPNLKQLMEVASPKGYYLYTWLPPLLETN